MRKILVTTTFRDFIEGNRNSEMQEEFLRSLTDQTYQNFFVVVTLFGEKNVESVVRRYLGDKVAFVNKAIPERFRYSPTEVICSGIEMNTDLDFDVLVDCSGDITLSDNFLECVEKSINVGTMGVCAPNTFVDSMGNVKEKEGKYPGGIDVRFFDSRILNREDVYLKLKNFPLYDWGGVEHFVTAIGVKYANNMINIFGESEVIKKENDREAANETNKYMKIGVARNHRQLKRLALRIRISPEDIVDIYWVYSQYQKIGQKNTDDKELNKKNDSNYLETASDKYWMLFSMMKDWCALYQKGKRISHYLHEHGFYSIAIYGLGDVGETLYNELKDTSIDIVCGIDQSDYYLIDDIDVITPNDLIPNNVDAIIVTPISAYEQIYNSLRNMTDACILSLEDIICSLMK